MRRILIDTKVGETEGLHTLLDLLQTEAMKRTRHRVVVRGPDGRAGEIRLAGGAVYRVSAGDFRGVDALKDILSWGIEEIEVKEEADGNVVVLDETCLPVNQLLLELVETVPGLRTATREEDQGMKTVEEMLRGVLRNMVDRLGGVDGAMLVDAEGFVIASHGTGVEGADQAEMVGGITTSLLTMTTKVAGVLGTGKVDRVMLHGADRHVFVSPVSPGANLVVIARRDASLGLIFAELRNMGGELQQALGGE
jgi:predicted regulator of Ras-like GTPase activity (Roadblock/LC7/MglB family)